MSGGQDPFSSRHLQDPRRLRLEVTPSEILFANSGETVQLKAVAVWPDGTREDVTRGALFEPNDKDLARAEETGLVRTYERPGDVAVMVRYQAREKSVRVDILKKWHWDMSRKQTRSI